VICLYLVLFSTGCTQNHVLKHQDIELSSSIIEPLPLKIGVYYPNEFRTYSFTYTYGGDHVFHVGESSVALFNKLLTKMFKTVVEVQGTNGPGFPSNDLDVIVELNVQSAYFSFGFSSSDDKLMLSYRFDLYTPSGELLTSWTTNASGSGPGKGTSWKRARVAMENALISAEKDFVVNCRKELAKHPGLFLKDGAQ
jgi:hypothetical protein